MQKMHEAINTRHTTRLREATKIHEAVSVWIITAVRVAKVVEGCVYLRRRFYGIFDMVSGGEFEHPALCPASPLCPIRQPLRTNSRQTAWRSGHPGLDSTNNKSYANRYTKQKTKQNNSYDSAKPRCSPRPRRWEPSCWCSRNQPSLGAPVLLTTLKKQKQKTAPGRRYVHRGEGGGVNHQKKKKNREAVHKGEGWGTGQASHPPKASDL